MASNIGENFWAWRKHWGEILRLPRLEKKCPQIRARICKRFLIDSKESVPPAYVAWRAGTITPFAVPALIDKGWRNRFLGSFNVYKFGLSREIGWVGGRHTSALPHAFLWQASGQILKTTWTVFLLSRIFASCLAEGKRRGVEVRTIL